MEDATWTTYVRQIGTGDTVKPSLEWLKSNGLSGCCLRHARGTVTAIENLPERTRLAYVAWNMPGMPERVDLADLEDVRIRGESPAFQR